MAENTSIPKVDRICRACCAESGEMSPIFDALQGSLPAMITFCTGLEVEKGDRKPAQICQLCLDHLQTAYDFKTTCLNSNDEFITMLYANMKSQKRKHNPMIKTEDGDVKIKKVEEIVEKKDIEVEVTKNFVQIHSNDSKSDENHDQNGKNGMAVDKLTDQNRNNEVEVELNLPNPQTLVKVEIVDDDEFSSDDDFDDGQCSDEDVPLSQVKKEPVKNEDKVKSVKVKRARDRRYRCSTCLEMFATRALWRQHLLSAHDVDESHEAGIGTGNPIKPGDKVFYSKDAVIIEIPSKTYVKNENENKKFVYGQVEIKKVKPKAVRRRKAKKEEVTIKKIKNGKVIKKGEKVLKSVKVKVKSENALSDNDSLPDNQHEMLGANFPLQRQTVTSQLKQYPMRCTVCDLKFTSVKECKQHKREVHGGESDTCVCDLCGKVCRIYTFRAHYGRHFKAPLACSAPGCSFREHAPNLVRTHEARVHGMHNLAKLQCPSCPQQFKYKGGLYDHIKRAHGNMKKDKLCPECGATFYKKDQLARHMQRHQGEKSLSCPVCGALFGYRSNLRVHALKYHDLDLPKLQGGFGNSVIVADKTLKDQFSSDKTKEKCPHCEFTSARARGIRAHIQNAHPELADRAPRAPKYRTPLKEGEQRTVFKCPQCPAQLSRNCHLKRHMVNVHGIKEPLNVQPIKVALPSLDAATIINAVKDESRALPEPPPLVEGVVKHMEE